ncbi:MAG: dTMP kinase [Tepidisphaeraceae bacterium]
MKNVRGKFIVFDGGEGCGKSTQAAMLRDALEASGSSVLLVHDPGTTRIGSLVRGILLDPDNTDMNMRCEMLLYMAARAQMITERILPALSDGKVVISDRFVSSTLAYQLGGDGLTTPDIRGVAEVAIKGRWPDLTIILDLPIEQSSARVQPKFLLPLPDEVTSKVGKDRIELRSMEYHDDVRKKYLQQAKTDPKRYRVIDASRGIDAIHADVMRAVQSLK